MKFYYSQPAGSNPRPRTAFTLVEMMFGVFIFSILFVGTLVSLQIFGLRIYSLGGTKLSASGAALKVLNRLRDDIRTAKSVDIGNCSTVSDPSTFQLTGDANRNVGGALRVCNAPEGTVPFSVYYLDSSGPSNVLKVAATADGTNFATPVVLATYITNRMVFTAEDCMKNVQLVDTHNRIIRMELDFSQWEYPVGMANGSKDAYDFYTLTTRITCRQIDY